MASPVVPEGDGDGGQSPTAIGPTNRRENSVVAHPVRHEDKQRYPEEHGVERTRQNRDAEQQPSQHDVGTSGACTSPGGVPSPPLVRPNRLNT